MNDALMLFYLDLETYTHNQGDNVVNGWWARLCAGFGDVKPM